MLIELNTPGTAARIGGLVGCASALSIVGSPAPSSSFIKEQRLDAAQSRPSCEPNWTRAVCDRFWPMRTLLLRAVKDRFSPHLGHSDKLPGCRKRTLSLSQ